MAPQVSEWPQRFLLILSSNSNMILYLLPPLLILGVVEPQTANMTAEELSNTENHTLTQSNADNSTMKPDNVTSTLYQDETRRIKDELRNKTSSFIAEDDESFQEQEESHHCHHDLLVDHIYSICGAVFSTEMSSISEDDWCVLKNIIRPYNNVTICLELLSNYFGCFYPNLHTEDFFLHIHSLYFQNCSKGELLADAPQGVVIALTLIPVGLIPILVYLVIWKSNVQE